MVTCYLVEGEDPSLVAYEAAYLIDNLLGEAERARGTKHAIEHIDAEESHPSEVILALSTPPLLAPSRLVVVRNAGSLPKAVLDELQEAAQDQDSQTTIVLLATGGTFPERLRSVLRSAGRIIDADPPPARQLPAWLKERAKRANLVLDAHAEQAILEHLGSELGRLPKLLELLSSVYGPGTRLGLAQVEPYLGEAGETAIWQLTAAIAKGDRGRALELARRATGAGRRHPLQVLAVLEREFQAALEVQGSEAEPTYSANLPPWAQKRAEELAQRLGFEGLARAMELLASCDLDLRGKSALAPEALLEVLVGRLAYLCGQASRARQPGQRRRSR
jgi:DNA polymerase-3 subunit delta